ncbi:MAG: RNA degradosome polyphosphate kinase [Lachnospiraceae bacterium]|jgi:polyphosphate kinase|nr:RNA degradosome polyphosphate kinase [Lachnospiraceae bacterium]
MSQFENPEYFISRELSWLEFNERVMEEAKDKKNPLLERFKFLAIVTSNLDEFFMVRVGSLYDQVQAGIEKKDAAGLSPRQQMKRVIARAHKMLDDQYEIYNQSLMPQLKKAGIQLLQPKQLSQQERDYLEEYFLQEIYPVLTPMAVDVSRPFPLILNRSLNIALLIERQEGIDTFATVQVPAVLSRLVPLRQKDSYILLEDVIRMHLSKIFPKQKIKQTAYYRITRNADMAIHEEDAPDLLKEMEKSIKKRKWGQAVRLEIESQADEAILAYLQKELDVPGRDVYEIHGPLDLAFVSKLSKIPGYMHLQYGALVPQVPKELQGETDIFEAIRKNDILLHHPYESFDSVVKFIEKAADDSQVLAIKQTLYRVSGQSPIIKALARAAENGKQVTVLVEVKARFDEENNIHWARRLEKAGCHVIYGLIGLKTHCKITLVVRREEEGIRRYVHLGTGNYNDVTARLYTDMGLFTCKESYGADASALFNCLSGYGDAPSFYKLTMAPTGLRKKFLALIQREENLARKGKKARIIAKMNSLLDTEIIQALYAASCAGVQIDLIVRGICCLKPGIAGVSENIRVRSIVGWLLEHSRVYYFYNDGHEEFYLSSADWMPRNLDRRIELLFPVEEERHKKRLQACLDLMLLDNRKARMMDQEGGYSKTGTRSKKPVNAQEAFYQLAIEESRIKENKEEKQEFQPVTAKNEL